MPGAAMRHRARKSRITGDRISPIDLFKVEVGKAAHQAGNVSARGLHLDRYRDRILVVFDDEHQRQPGIGGGVQGLPKFAFAGSAFAERNVGNLVAVELDVFELAVIARGLMSGFRMSGEITAGLGAAYGLQNLGSGRR